MLCGRGRKEGVTICADHIRSLDKGGINTVRNGQTLCMEHNIMKKNYSQNEAGKKFFIRMYEQALANNDKKMINFCKCIFYCYDQYKISTHIKRPDKKR